MTQAIAGHRGVLKVSTGAASTDAGSFTNADVVAVAEVRDWSIEMDADQLDVTSKDSSGFGHTIPGIVRWRGGAEYLQVMGSSVHKSLFDAVTNHRTLTFVFFPSGDSSDGLYRGTANVSHWGLGSPLEDATLSDIEFVGTDRLERFDYATVYPVVSSSGRLTLSDTANGDDRFLVSSSGRVTVDSTATYVGSVARRHGEQMRLIDFHVEA